MPRLRLPWDRRGTTELRPARAGGFHALGSSTRTAADFGFLTFGAGLTASFPSSTAEGRAECRHALPLRVGRLAGLGHSRHAVGRRRCPGAPLPYAAAVHGSDRPVTYARFGLGLTA